MFQSVINQPGIGARRFGTGVWMSLMVHAGVFASVLGLSGKAVEKIQYTGCELGPIRRVVQSSRGNSTPSPTPAPQPRPQPRRKHRPELAQPRNSPPPPANETPRQVESAPSEGTTTAANASSSTSGGQLELDAIGGPVGPDLVDSIARIGTGEDVLPFGSGMTPPEMLSGAQLQYTREALAARVSGLVIARCTITREGSVEDCRIIKGLPHMDEAVLDALSSRRYQPVHFQGRPVSVSYTFNVKLRLP